MSPNPKLIYEKPNIENTIPLSVYQSSSPEKFSLEDDDKFVIYAGGKNYCLQILKNDPSHDLKLSPRLSNIDYSRITLFVLNTSFVMWFDNLDLGLELPYQTIILHALQTVNTSKALYMQLISNKYLTSIPKEQTEYVSSVELLITRNEATQSEANPLFQNSSSTIEEIYDSLSKCSSFHYDSDSEGEDNNKEFFAFDSGGDFQQQALEIPTSWIADGNDDNQVVALKNTGDADDIEIDEDNEILNSNEDIPVAGMNVEVGYASIAGSIRKRDDDLKGEVKSRRLA